MRHSPGPWTFFPPCTVKSDSDVYIVLDGPNDEEAEANGLLVAAAPDLLVALKVVVRDWVDQFERQGHTAPAWCQQATAAILKAEGPPK